MNKTFVAAFAVSLLAGTSAFAQEHHRGDHGGDRQGHAAQHRQDQDRQRQRDQDQREQRSDNRPARPVPQVSNERARAAIAQARARQAERDDSRGERRDGPAAPRAVQSTRQTVERRTTQQRVVVPRVAPRTDTRQTDRNRYDRRDNGDQRVYLRGGRDSNHDGDRYRRPGEGHQLRDRDHGRTWYSPDRWRRTYHATHRYRTQHYRNPPGFYIRSWVFGDFLPQAWYAPNYYLDWWSYGLPRPPIGTEWVRSGDDALLVDTWSGEVLSVYYDLFW